MSKTFNEQQNIGRAKYVVNHHDGVKTHGDGSPFFEQTEERGIRKATMRL